MKTSIVSLYLLTEYKEEGMEKGATMDNRCGIFNFSKLIVL